MRHIHANNSVFRRQSAPRCAQGRAQAGFTFAEVLAALAILVVLGTLVTSAMLTGSRMMAQTTATSNSAVLEQSLETALSDLLHYASVHAPSSDAVVDNPSFDTDSYFDYTGSAVRNGILLIQDGKLALQTAGGVQYIPKAVGIYTDFMLTDFNISYNAQNHVFTINYTLAETGSTYTRSGEFSCRTLSNEIIE